MSERRVYLQEKFVSNFLVVLTVYIHMLNLLYI